MFFAFYPYAKRSEKRERASRGPTCTLFLFLRRAAEFFLFLRSSNTDVHSFPLTSFFFLRPILSSFFFRFCARCGTQKPFFSQLCVFTGINVLYSTLCSLVTCFRQMRCHLLGNRIRFPPPLSREHGFVGLWVTFLGRWVV